MGRVPTKLTGKQELFIQGIVKGWTKRKSYEKAGYSCKMDETKINIQAQKIFNNPNVNLRYNELVDKHKKKALWTREMAIEELKKALTISTEDRTMNTLISAVKELNSLEGLYPKEEKNIVNLEDNKIIIVGV